VISPLAVARAFFLRGLRETLSYRVASLLRLLATALSLASFFYLARFINLGASPHLARYGGDYLAFGLFGIVLLGLQHGVVAAYPRSIREAQLAGTLEAMLATPTPPWMVLLFSPLFELASSLVWGGLYLLVGSLVLGADLSRANAAGLAAAVPLVLLAFASLGAFAASFTMLFRRGDPISTFLSGLSALLGGALYPTAVLPRSLLLVGKLLPLTHALEAIRRAALAGAGPSALVSPLASLALFVLVLGPLGLLAFALALSRARKDGSLSQY
jgi:ABC-2 type transport system permease protein